MGEMITAMAGDQSFGEPPVVVDPTTDVVTHHTVEHVGLRPERSHAPANPMDGFADLYRARFDDSVRLARFLTGSWDEARDLVQDAFCGLHRNWRSVTNPEAYLRRSIVNGVASHHRRRGRDRARALPEVGVTELGAAELTDALAALPERQRAAIVLRFQFDLPDAAIADALGIRAGTVASLIHRGLAALHLSLTDQPDS